MQTTPYAASGSAPAPGPVDAYVDTVEALAAALAVDPVNVQEVVGNGHTAQVDAALTELVASAEVPVVVALVGDLPGLEQTNPSADLISRLQARLGQDGFYVVAVGGRSPDWGYAGTDDVLEDTVGEGLREMYSETNDSDPGAGDAGLAALVTSVIADPDHRVDGDRAELYTESRTWTEVDYESAARPPLPSEVAAWSALLGVLVALVGWRLTRTWVLRSVVPAPPPVAPRSLSELIGLSAAAAKGEAPPRSRRRPAVADVRRDAARTLTSLADDLADDLAGQGGGPRLEEAIGCRVAAERVLDSEELLDVVGALVLARAGRHLLRTGETYRPCFVDPLHGAGVVEIEIVKTGPMTPALAVPACRRCGSTTRRLKQLRPLLEPARGLRGARPYFEGDTLWARTGYGALDPDVWRRVVQER